MANLPMCAILFAGDEIDRELVEIAENLHRSDLTALERDEQTARYIELTELRQKREDEVLAQIAQKPGRGDVLRNAIC